MYREVNEELYSYADWVNACCPPKLQWRNTTFAERESFVLSARSEGIFSQPEEYPCIMKSYEESDPHDQVYSETHFYFIYIDDLEEELEYYQSEISELDTIIKRMKDARAK